MLRAVLATAALLLTAGLAHGQLSRHERQIELQRLDFHPRPSFLADARIYGAVDLAVSVGSRGTSVGPLSASHVGILASELLGQGWQANVRLEHGFDASTGAPADSCQPFWGRGATVGLAHRGWGRVDLGRQDQPAWHVALLADPWRGSAVASPGDASIYLPLVMDGYRPRSNNAVQYTSPENRSLVVRLLVASTSCRSDTRYAQTDDEGGFSMVYRSGAWHAGIGWHRWDGNTSALPVAAAYAFGFWTARVGLTFGDANGRRFTNVLLAATSRQRSGPRPGVFQIALNLHEQEGRPQQWKAGAGYVYPFSKRTALHWELGIHADEGGTAKGQGAVGVRHEFSL